MKFSTSLALSSIVHQGYSILDADEISSKYYGNDASWYRNRIPLFESSDQDITDTYYYRWSIFRAHQRDIGTYGFISTEFLDDVSWQTKPWASLNDATGFHLLEGRWCRDRRFKEDYATFIYSDDSNRRQFSESMAASVWQGYLVDGSEEDAVKRLDAMQTVYEAWQDSFDTSKGLYYVEPIRDATEYTISSIDASGGYDGFFGGNSFRPTINSYQYANAKAIASIAAMKGGMESTIETYNERATALKQRVQDALWNSTFEHFIDRFQVNNTNVTYWDFIRGRELAGIVPWTHDLPDDTTEYAQAWSHVLNSSELAGEAGLRTVEPSYEYYMRQYRYEGPNPECQWNGPVWPFQFTQVLTGLANFLDHYRTGAETGIIDTADYTAMLKQYAQLHRNPETGVLDLEEDYYPDTGLPIVGLKRSHHYFHSGFNDLVLSGLVGIRPSAADILEVNPLADASISYFRAERIVYHGRDIAVQWDADGSRYGGSPGLQIEVDGQVVASQSTLGRIKVDLERKPAPKPMTMRIAKSIQLSSTTPFPRGTVSTADDTAEATYPAIDGRVWFYPEPDAKNGWDSPVGNGTGEVWFEIDFGAEVASSSAELAFFADEEQGYAAPTAYRIQVPGDAEGAAWSDVPEATYQSVVANGITDVSWTEVRSQKVRLVFTPTAGAKVRLVEFKVF
ncbi:six-hairpin glycosidase [Stemphylium lycopersici]|uniref:Six-hairpin glycosidase n=1 Tax=Stemphylium lycopersici TaxID=183478 RepID=A0A364NB19_STELY|nr:six-hairpin glycosidase [Stemphylium lycopersici]